MPGLGRLGGRGACLAIDSQQFVEFHVPFRSLVIGWERGVHAGQSAQFLLLVLQFRQHIGEFHLQQHGRKSQYLIQPHFSPLFGSKLIVLQGQKRQGA